MYVVRLQADLVTGSSARGRCAPCCAGCPEAERQARFVEIWTLKEAYVKATGDGLGAGLGEFAFTYDDATSLTFETADRTQASAFEFALFEVRNDYRLAVAVRDEAPDTRVVRVGDHGSDDSRPPDTPVVLRRSLGLIGSGR